MLKIFLLLLLTTAICVRCDEDGEQSDGAATIAEPKPQYVRPVPTGPFHFLETFDALDAIGKKWIKSLAKKLDVDEMIAKYDGEWSIESAVDSALEGDRGLVLKTKAKHHAISARLDQQFDFTKQRPLVLQYEVKFQNALECGGAYVKLLSSDKGLNLEQFVDKTPYTIMFGPDKCGNENKLHFILRHRNPVSNTFEEKHAKKIDNLEMYFNDGRTHLYTLIVRPDNTFTVLIDQNVVNTGSLLTDLQPPITPEKEIVDPADKKPETWDEREQIPDPEATKPEDWDESEPKELADPNATKPETWLEDEQPTVADPTAVKPVDWDDETDGEWEAPRVDNPKCANGVGCGKWSPPMIKNPKYKGKWKAPLVSNPNYQGQWAPRRIPNPDYFEDNDPFRSITPVSAIGLELWSMNDNIYFDNFIIADDEEVANELAKDSWALKKTVELRSSPASTTQSVIDAIVAPTKERPWLWAVYLLAVLVPIILIVVFCCGSSNKKSEAATAKKTDATTRDDTEQEQTEETAPTAQEQNEESDEAAAVDEEEEVEEDNSADLKKSTQSLNKEDVEEEAEPVTTQRTSPRQRRARKE